MSKGRSVGVDTNNQSVSVVAHEGECYGFVSTVAVEGGPWAFVRKSRSSLPPVGATGPGEGGC